MKLKDLKPGYLVKLRNGKFGRVDVNDHGLFIIHEDFWSNISAVGYDLDYNDDMTRFDGLEELDIVEVWGYCRFFLSSMELSTEYRPIIWKQEPPKEMTLKEIEYALGYKVKLIQ